MSLAYADEKLAAGIRTLATGPDRIRPRLVAAVATSIGHIKPEEDLPEELREEFEALLARLTKEWPKEPGDGKLQATVKEMSEDEAVELANEILSFASRIAGTLEYQRKEAT